MTEWKRKKENRAFTSYSLLLFLSWMTQSHSICLCVLFFAVIWLCLFGMMFFLFIAILKEKHYTYGSTMLYESQNRTLLHRSSQKFHLIYLQFVRKIRWILNNFCFKYYAQGLKLFKWLSNNLFWRRGRRSIAITFYVKNSDESYKIVTNADSRYILPTF